MTRREGTAAATWRATWYCGTATTTAMGEAKGSLLRLRENMGGRRHKFQPMTGIFPWISTTPKQGLLQEMYTLLV